MSNSRHLTAQPGASFSTSLTRWRQNLFVFSGTASRSEFWKIILWWLLAWLIMSFVLFGVWVYIISQAHYLAGYHPESIWQIHEFRVWLGIASLMSLFWVLFTILNAGLGSRRLQDVGIPGWVFWFCLVPPGLLAVLIICAIPSRTVSPTPTHL